MVALDLLRGEVEGLSGESQVTIAFRAARYAAAGRAGAIAAIMVFMRD